MSRLGIMGGYYNPLISLAKELPGREQKIANIADLCHCALCNKLKEEVLTGFQEAVFATCCFLGSEKVIRERSIDSNYQRAVFQTKKEEDMVLPSHRRKIERVGCCLEDG
jgi:hypothetical protein